MKFTCATYLASHDVTYEHLSAGVPDRTAWFNMKGAQLYAHARRHSNPVAISSNGQYYSLAHRPDEARIDVRDAGTGALAHLFRLPKDFAIEQLSPDGRRALLVNKPVNGGGPQYTRVLAIDTRTSEVTLDLSAPKGFNELHFGWVNAEFARVHFVDGTRLYRFGKQGPAQLIATYPSQAGPRTLRMTIPTPNVTQLLRLSVRGFDAPAFRTGEEWRSFTWRPTRPLDATKLRGVAIQRARPKYSLDYNVSASGRWLAMHGSQGFRDPVTGGSFESFVDLFDIARGELVKRFFVSARVIMSVAFSPDETELAWAGGGVVEVVDIASERKVFSDLRDELDAPLITDLAFIDANRLLMYDGHARLRSLRFRTNP